MVEVNEEIVRKWLEEVKGFFVVTDVKYRVQRGWSDIDIIAHHPITNEAWVVQVKGWHTETVYPSYVKIIKPQLSNLAIQQIRNKMGTRPFSRILVISKLSKKQQTRNTTISAFRAKGVNDVYDFGQILEDLINTIDVHKSYDSEVLQILRLLKIYDFLK